jgi:SAM-dependent methyltransferase
VLDLGCGGGAQTLHLAELLPGASITAIDAHAPLVERLRREAALRGLSDRVRAVLGDMAEIEVPPGGADLVWSEGALYNLGLERALNLCRGLLRPGGHLVFTEPVWRAADPPREVKALFEDYPAMGTASDVVAAIERAGLSLVDHFSVPDEAWWTDFYTPMERRIDELGRKYADDAEALAALDQLAEEPALHRRHGSTYAYELFVARR